MEQNTISEIIQPKTTRSIAHKSFHRFLQVGLILLGVVVVFLGMFLPFNKKYFGVDRVSEKMTLTGSGIAQDTATFVASTTALDVSLKKLKKDISIVTPQFVNDTESVIAASTSSLPLELHRIREDFGLILHPLEWRLKNVQSYDPADLILFAVGKRYILYTVAVKKDGGALYSIFDSVTQNSANIVPEQGPIYSDIYQPLFKTEKTMIFVTRNNLCAYVLDGSSCVQIAGAKLAGDEVYGAYEMGGLGGVEETHTDSSFTITVFKQNKNGLLVKNRVAKFLMP